MRICFAALFFDSRRVCRRGADYLSQFPLFRELPQKLADRGHHVDVVHAYPWDFDYAEGRVCYHFVASGDLARAWGHLAGRLTGRHRSELEPARRAIDRIVDLDPDLVHFSGVTLHLNLNLLVRHLDPDMGLVLHHHGGGLSKRWLARRAQGQALARASRLLVSSPAHATPFLEAGLLRESQVEPFMETSSPFRWQPRLEARRHSGMEGDPIFLSAGRLHPIKDPFTLLRGFERIAAVWPGARLYLYYLTNELEGEIRTWLSSRPELAKRVEPRGRVSMPEMEAIMNSADFFLQASRREWSGIAVLDAMACGVVPIVTEIPAFQAMTEGLDGLLFPVGDDEALARRVFAIGRGEIEEWSEKVRRRFEEHLSFKRLAAQLEEIYLSSPRR